MLFSPLSSINYYFILFLKFNLLILFNTDYYKLKGDYIGEFFY